MNPAERNLTWHGTDVSAELRKSATGAGGCTLWLTGLSGSGKSTVAVALERALLQRRVAAFRLDGDNVRHGLCADLGFGPEHRAENIRRVGEVCRLMAEASVVVIAAFVSPYRGDRDRVRQIHAAAGLPFFEVHVSTPIEVCRSRDPKGLYKKADAGEIADFTGVSAPYEPPDRPELVLPTHELGVEESVEHCLRLLEHQRRIEAT
ncbi:MAG: adenylyl-sulfate kinase [Phycisphaerae bacterium]